MLHYTQLHTFATSSLSSPPSSSPVISSSLSARVLLPWSTWATILKFLTLSSGNSSSTGGWGGVQETLDTLPTTCLLCAVMLCTYVGTCTCLPGCCKLLVFVHFFFSFLLSLKLYNMIVQVHVQIRPQIPQSASSGKQHIL